MLDVAVSYNRFKFLGCEFLTWIWFIMENQEDILKKTDKELVSLDIGNRIVLENNRNNTIESITIKGDEAGLEEGVLSLKKGAVVTELNLIYKAGNHEWHFNIKGESLNISGLKTPETGKVEKKEDIEGAVLEKVLLCEKVLILVNNLYKQFINLRVTNKWNKDVVPLMQKWIAS
jgi:hypothetical protein